MCIPDMLVMYLANTAPEVRSRSQYFADTKLSRWMCMDTRSKETQGHYLMFTLEKSASYRLDVHQHAGSHTHQSSVGMVFLKVLNANVGLSCYLSIEGYHLVNGML